ncbi:MAG TPA: ParB N-terminal domain-containing protein [Anaerolineales bacterium]
MLQTNLPTLTFLPTGMLLIHELHDDQRTRPLILRIRSTGLLRNPPIVSPLQDGSGRYMVLDGANRTTALREMGFPHVLVQVVQPDDPGLSLHNWSHVVWELNPSRFLTGLREIPQIHLVPADDATEPSLEGDCGLALIKTCKGHTYAACTPVKELETRAALLRALVDSYKDRARLDRTNTRDVQLLAEIYPLLSGLVVFPQFRIQDLLCLVGQGHMLPAGITRFTISPRALHVNYPLSELAADKPLDEKNEALHQWLQERLARKAVRYYAEATILFDE